jgi:hypothetical protein
VSDLPPIDEPPERPAPLTGVEEKGSKTMTAEHLPTPESKAKVIALACLGHNQTRIAEHLDVDGKTLRKWYATELTFARENVGAEAVSHLTRLMKGDGVAALGAVKYFLSCRCGWAEKSSITLDLDPPHEGGLSAREILAERLETIHRRMNEDAEAIAQPDP